MKEIWVRRLDSFEDERRADDEFWASMTPDERVAAVTQMRVEAAEREGKPLERLRRVVRVIDASRR